MHVTRPLCDLRHSFYLQTALMKSQHSFAFSSHWMKMGGISEIKQSHHSIEIVFTYFRTSRAVVLNLFPVLHTFLLKFIPTTHFHIFFNKKWKIMKKEQENVKMIFTKNYKSCLIRLSRTVGVMSGMKMYSSLLFQFEHCAWLSQLNSSSSAVNASSSVVIL